MVRPSLLLSHPRTDLSMDAANVSARKATIKRVRARGRWQGRFKTELHVRGFAPFFTAEPEKLGGDNAAPTPMEYVVAALNGCLAVVVEMVAGEQDFRLEGLEIEAEGLIDQAGPFGTAPVSPHFQSVVSRARFRTPESAARLQALEREVLRRCPAYNLLRDAGIPIQIDWSIVPECTPTG